MYTEGMTKMIQYGRMATVIEIVEVPALSLNWVRLTQLQDLQFLTSLRIVKYFPWSFEAMMIDNNFLSSLMGLSIGIDISFQINFYPWDAS